MPTQGGDAIRVLQGVRNYSWWRVLTKGIYFVDSSSTPARIKFFDFAIRRSKEVTSVDFGPRVPGPICMDISPDEKWILFMRVDEVDSDIMLVDNFH